MNANLDPILLEVFKNGFETVADEMALILMRTAHSPIVRDSMDYSTAICDPQGQTLAQGLTTPMHLGSFYDAMRHLMDEYKGRVDPGDVFIANDPYAASGQHLPDIYVIKPIFHEGVLCAWATTIAHHSDVGGLVPGSNSIGATEIYQEGLRLPFLKLVAAGVESEVIMSIIATNVRVPYQVLGDLRAQMAACAAGERGMLGLLKRYGAAKVAAYGEALQDYAEALARAAFEQIPDGVYLFTDHIDGFGDDPQPVVLNLTLTVAGAKVTADWTGSSPQVKAGINAPISFCKSNVYAALRSLMPGDVPNCHGYTRLIEVIAPPGTVVSCISPAPCGARGVTGYRIVDCVFGALSKALPDQVAADGAGGSTLPSFGGLHEGKPFVFSECVMGTWGATSQHDGQEGVPHMASNQSNVPIEMIEADYPIRIEAYGFVPDTGGAGQFRGGLGILRQYRCLSDDTYFGVRSDKRLHPPHGMAGGGEGAPASNLIIAGGRSIEVPTMPTEPITLNNGDVFRHVMAGGGGFGSALERDVGLVLEDVLDDKMTAGHALDVYGVVFSEGRIDLAATDARRSLMRQGSPE